MASEVGRVLAGCRSALISVGVLSAGVNVLALTGSIFMLAVYDRVIPSGSIPTLISLGLIALAMFALQALAEIFRSRMLTRIGLVVKEAMSTRSFDLIVRNASVGEVRSANAVRDLDQLQGFMSSLGPTIFFDLPWVPLYLFICYLFHPDVGLTVTIGAVVLIALTALSNAATKSPTEALNDATVERGVLLTSSQGQSETIQAMGMAGALSRLWENAERNIGLQSGRLADVTSSLGGVSRAFRLMLQSLVLGVGAYLVINHEATGGIMIASSILSARALAPIEMAIGHWKNYVAFRQSWKRLDGFFAAHPIESAAFRLPPPMSRLSVEAVSVALPLNGRLVARDISVSLNAGEALGIVGPTGSGKSSLVRAIVGLWPTVAGSIRLDGQLISHWSTADRGRFVGYLPQSVTLFQGTIAQNISRFDPGASEASIIEAATAAGVHGVIVRTPDGYNTRVGEGGVGLSGGQAQWIGLARALYNNPFLVVLDEPNSNLDGEGEAALQAALLRVKARGGIAVVVAHRPSMLDTVDAVLVMTDGRVQRYGRTQEILGQLLKRPTTSVSTQEEV